MRLKTPSTAKREEPRNLHPSPATGLIEASLSSSDLCGYLLPLCNPSDTRIPCVVSNKQRFALELKYTIHPISSLEDVYRLDSYTLFWGSFTAHDRKQTRGSASRQGTWMSPLDASMRPKLRALNGTRQQYRVRYSKRRRLLQNQYAH